MLTHQASRIPERRHSHIAVRPVVPVVDAEPVPSEIAEADAGAEGSNVLAPDVDPLEQTLAGREEQYHGRERNVPRPGILLTFWDELELILVPLGRGVGDGLLAEQIPPTFHRDARERLIVVPAGAGRRAEQLLGVTNDLRPHVVDGQRETSHQHMRLGACLQHVEDAVRDHRELGPLRRSELHPERLLDLLDPEEVTPHDRFGRGMIGFDLRRVDDRLVDVCSHMLFQHRHHFVDPRLVTQREQHRQHGRGHPTAGQGLLQLLPHVFEERHFKSPCTCPRTPGTTGLPSQP